MGQITTRSPFTPESLPRLGPIAGVRFATAEAGIKYRGRTDLMVAVLDAGTTAAGVLTQSKTASAPVLLCREHLKGGAARLLIVNSGNANAFTGKRGREAVEITVEAGAKAARCATGDVFVASTGVIGEPLDAGKFAHLLDKLVQDAAPDAFELSARAIMTTDTYPKLATRTARIGGVEVTINGFCKGAGMIAPDMATMLAFIFTDAAIGSEALQALLSEHVVTTFNSMTIDGDTSTSDTCLLFATGAAEARGQARVTDAADPALAEFSGALHDLMRDLAIQVAKDGEGLSKFVTFIVEGAESVHAARRIALACANSPILKTAIAGEDPNWGRVVMAVGKAGEAADRDKLAIWFGPYCVARDGERAAEYDEATVAAYMKNREIVIRVNAGVGEGTAHVWTCDLTHDYVSINADYRS
ncbi:bifunctional glutamate N-acetyltransferase/amino-acid acetyltransferase ArgJ [Hyphomicrobium sp.]|uniref:bifunctional glutamate N-acetyltransferase/amino-acid acetyltransferase ArgJ n=1 Tax=Hyphomicrobium sp. TaxID=82 RepID=UPI002B95E597|nr:bifunctional glutamate N-acetyltransferase/amino-acid acetyltransferase ArgJ [Hyphomicrobium sp.]HRN87059.1 bifunctional glutamate N-acetyltransferase/amino-acid acetyltransferase ArgJ [Hyphomicrobium sp.]HRQ26377.1 bifunctional glutamate N-acetyltransferase/amino-acid acetyltransferase ArgJ [Hyphomicrobium sp.]